MVLDPATAAVSQILAFPLNPESLVRSLDPPSPPQSPVEPREVLSFSLTLDATDALASRDPQATAEGVRPLLSALEMLMYSPTEAVPPVLFVWGGRRILPVRVTSLQITEQSFDAKLTPILVRVAVTLLALKEADLPPNSKARAVWEAHVHLLQQLAASAVNGTLADLGLTGPT